MQSLSNTGSLNTIARCAMGLALLAALTSASGCTYAKDRLKDTVDIVGFKVLAGPGSKVGLGVGPARTGLMFGYYRFEKFGFRGRAMGVIEETGFEFFAPIDRSKTAVWGNKELFDMVEEFQQHNGRMARAKLFDHQLTYPRSRYSTPDGFMVGDAWPGAYFPPSPFMPGGLLSLGDIQITFAPIFVGFELNFSFFQLVDWALGWFYIDIAKDDTRNYTPVGPRDDD